MKKFCLLFAFLAAIWLGLSQPALAQKNQTIPVFGYTLKASIPDEIPGYAVRWRQVREMTIAAINREPTASSRTEAIGRLMQLIAQQSELVEKEFARIAVKNNMDIAEVVELFLQNSGSSIDPKVQYESNLLGGLTHLYNCLRN